MIQEIKRAKRFAAYLARSQSDRWLHSPFLFDLYSEVFKNDKSFYSFANIERLREDLKNDVTPITITDFGAGSKKFKGNERRIKDIAKTALKPAKQCQQLFRLANFIRPSTIIELGTSLGITTAYLASANTAGEIITFEGCPEHLKIATGLWSKLHLTNISPQLGNIDETLKRHIQNCMNVDMVFFDANHRYKPTLEYFELCLSKIHEQSVFIFDDIHWSDEMFKAWNEIVAHSQVTVSIDLFHLGILFFDTSLSKQHFVLR